MSKIYLVTGANSGLGFDSVRKLALLNDTKLVYLACRSKAKASNAMDSLVTDYGVDKSKLRYVHFDCCDSKGQLSKITEDIDQPIHGIILNAGGIGSDKTGKPDGPNNVVPIYQMNVVGNLQLVEILLEASLLAQGCRIVYSSSEAARGVPIMMIGNPTMGDSSQWFEERLSGKAPNHNKYNVMATYGKAKGVASLYWSAWARRHPEYHVLSVSPGGTDGTEGLSAEAVPGHFKVMMPIMKPMMRGMGAMHDLEHGSQRYVDAVLGTGEMAHFKSGTFVASKKGTTGPVCDQSQLKVGKKYGDRKRQEAAFSALAPIVMA